MKRKTFAERLRELPKPKSNGTISVVMNIFNALKNRIKSPNHVHLLLTCDYLGTTLAMNIKYYEMSLIRFQIPPEGYPAVIIGNETNLTFKSKKKFEDGIIEYLGTKEFKHKYSIVRILN